ILISFSVGDEDIVKYRLEKERLIEKKVSVNLPTAYGNFKLHLYRSQVDDYLHIALCHGNLGETNGSLTSQHQEPVLVRVHDECLTGDVFCSLRCDCGEQLHSALKMIQKEGRGVVLYMRQEGRGIGLENKLHAYALQEREGLDTVEANERLGFLPDKRDYGVGAQILKDLGIAKMRLLTNNPKKFKALEGYGLEIVERVPIPVTPRKENIGYLETKKKKLGHLIDGI
ncbi:MAG TPA: GTP cyclohydrolase II, partial [Candidatus Hypogeohydataceae bacterium YC40]